MSNKNQRLIAIAIVVIIALLGINGYLLYDKINKDKLIEQQKAELIDTEKMQAELEKEYYQSLSDLEEMKSTNAELNSIIESQQQELKSQKDRISLLIRDKKDLETARTELARFKELTAQYVDEIETLKQENEQLAEANTILSEEKRILTSEVQKEREANEELSTAQAELLAEKASLEEEKTSLSRTVNFASVIKVENIEATGYRLRNSGKESERKKASVIDGLKIGFTTTENVVAGSGVERFYVRVIDPLGETLAIEDLGSGVLTSSENEAQIRFTQYRDLEYEQEPTNVCVNWQPGLTFNPGNYTVEIYNKGHLAGTTTFSLK
ncbi:MAG: hypothetical protein R3301_10480 [Saprospiraceae bacterium]|nr:hypothetical protein [Saprospiraceae bacterium]